MLERIRLDELDVRCAVAVGILACTLECVRRGVDRGDMIGATREVESERAVVAEAIERAAARDRADEYAVLALVEERPCLLPGPRRRELAYLGLVHLDLVRPLASDQRRLGGKALLGRRAHSVGRGGAAGGRMSD